MRIHSSIESMYRGKEGLDFLLIYQRENRYILWEILTDFFGRMVRKYCRKTMKRYDS